MLNLSKGTMRRLATETRAFVGPNRARLLQPDSLSSILSLSPTQRQAELGYFNFDRYLRVELDD